MTATSSRRRVRPAGSPLVDLLFGAAAATLALAAVLWAGAAAGTYLSTGHLPAGPLTAALAALTQPRQSRGGVATAGRCPRTGRLLGRHPRGPDRRAEPSRSPPGGSHDLSAPAAGTGR